MASDSLVMKDGLSFDGVTDLKNYSEGTWVPGISTTGTVGTPSYSSQNGKYVRVGNLVFIECALGVSSWAGSPTGVMDITGLPFAVFASSIYGYWLAEGVNLTVPANQILCVTPNAGTTKCRINSLTLAGGSAGGLSVDTAFSIFFSGVYQTS